MGTYIRTCAEIKTDDGWQPVNYGEFPPVEWHELNEYEPPALSEPFKYQDYGMFGLFSGESNYSKSKVLAEPRGLPSDISEGALLHLVPEIVQFETNWDWGELPEVTVTERISRSEPDCYGFSWLSAAELISFDYSQTFINRRPEPPEIVTYREFLGAHYFLHLDVLKKLSVHNDVRLLFCFN